LPRNWLHCANTAVKNNRVPKASLQAATVGGSADEIEAAFYEALQSGDIDRLMACWADEEDIVCVHPGGPRLLGAVSIRNSFETMFANGVIPAHPEHVRKVVSLTCAVHNLVERIELNLVEGTQVAYVLATNVYMRTAQGWRLVAHHASPGTPQEMLAHVETLPAVLH
jgi:ketosteroid isomerase-like protein